MLGSTSWIYSISGLRTRTMDSFSSSSSFRMDCSNSCPCISEPWTVPFPGVVSEQWTAPFPAAVFQNHGQFLSCPLYFRTVDSFCCSLTVVSESEPWTVPVPAAGFSFSTMGSSFSWATSQFQSPCAVPCSASGFGIRTLLGSDSWENYSPESADLFPSLDSIAE